MVIKAPSRKEGVNAQRVFRLVLLRRNIAICIISFIQDLLNCGVHNIRMETAKIAIFLVLCGNGAPDHCHKWFDVCTSRNMDKIYMVRLWNRWWIDAIARAID